MADPIGFINQPQGIRPVQPPAAPNGTFGAQPGAGAPSFKDVLMENLREANAAQVDATRAVEDLATGQRSDVEGVILATQPWSNIAKENVGRPRLFGHYRRSSVKERSTNPGGVRSSILGWRTESP